MFGLRFRLAAVPAPVRCTIRLQHSTPLVSHTPLAMRCLSTATATAPPPPASSSAAATASGPASAIPPVKRKKFRSPAEAGATTAAPAGGAPALPNWTPSAAPVTPPVPDLTIAGAAQKAARARVHAPAPNARSLGMGANGKQIAIFGLGNPGDKYVGTRHNIGREIVQSLAAEHDIKMSHSSHASNFGHGTIADRKVVIAVPTTYMNSSGNSVKALSHELKIYEKNIIVVYDDMSIPVGTIRIADHGSDGGQNGIKHIISVMGPKTRLVRVRIGIAPPVPPGSPQTTHDMIPVDRPKFVLGKFGSHEQQRVGRTIGWAKECIRSLLDVGLARSMTLFNKSLEAAAEESARRDAQRKQQIKFQLKQRALDHSPSAANATASATEQPPAASQ